MASVVADAVPRHLGPDHVGRRARPARPRVPPGLPDRPALLRRLHGRPRRHRHRLVHGRSRRTRTAPTRLRSSILLTITQPFANHNGGAVAFGPDGMLYIAMGDGGSGGDPEGNGQRLDTLLGKILRIDVLGSRRHGRGAVRRPARQPVRRLGRRRRHARDLADRPAQPVAHPVRCADGRPVDRRRRPGRLGGGRRHPVRIGRRRTWAGTRWKARTASPSSPCDTAGLTLPVAEYDHDARLLDRRRGRRPRPGRARRSRAATCSATTARARSGRSIRTATTLASRPSPILESGRAISAISLDEDGSVLVTDLNGGQLLRVVERPVDPASAGDRPVGRLGRAGT